MASRGTAGGDFELSDPVGSFVEVARRAALQPAAFFASLPRSGGFAGPLVFALICVEVSVILVGLLNLLGLPGGGLWLAAPRGDQGFFAFVGALVISPIAAAIWLLVSTLVMHLMVTLVVGSNNAGFLSTFKVACYSSVTALVGWLPFIGLIFGLYRLYLAVVGIREMHATTMGKAALVVLLPFVVLLILALVVLGTSAALFFRPF